MSYIEMVLGIMAVAIFLLMILPTGLLMAIVVRNLG